MEPVFFLVAIMGCTDADASCREARVLPARYATAAQCQAALPQRLAENSDVGFPTIEANCRASGPRLTSAARARSRG